MNSLETEHKLINNAFKKIEKFGWDDFNIEKFSKDEKIPLEKVNFFFSTKTILLKKFSKMIDHKVELNLSIQDINSSTIKDNLFELIMLRFEEMQIYKNSLKMIIRSTKDKPILLTSTISYNTDEISLFNSINLSIV